MSIITMTWIKTPDPPAVTNLGTEDVLIGPAIASTYTNILISY